MVIFARLSYGPLAQLVEQGTLNPLVTGSSPVRVMDSLAYNQAVLLSLPAFPTVGWCGYASQPCAYHQNLAIMTPASLTADKEEFVCPSSTPLSIRTGA